MVRALRLIVAIVGAASLSVTVTAQCYTEMLKTDPDDPRAAAELTSTRAEAAAVPN